MAYKKQPTNQPTTNQWLISHGVTNSTHPQGRLPAAAQGIVTFQGIVTYNQNLVTFQGIHKKHTYT